MKLYKFLLISDKVINDIMELIEDGGESNYHKNSIYAIKKEYMDINIAFIRFSYPNEGTYPWAYTIIDKDDISDVSKCKWGTTKDKIGNNHQSKDKPYTNPNRIVDERRTELLINAVKAVKKQEIMLDIEALQTYKYIKTGGWLNNPSPEMGYLHKYIMGVFSGNIRVHHKG